MKTRATKPMHTDKSAPQSVDQAAAVLANLSGKREALANRQAEIAKRRQALAFTAHTAGGKALDELNALNREVSALNLEAEDLDTAITAAHGKVTEARQAEARAAAVSQAEENLTFVANLREAAGAFDAALNSFAGSILKIRGAARDAGINLERVDGLLRRALQGKLFELECAEHGMHLHSEVFPPNQRGPFAGMIEPVLAFTEGQQRRVIAGEKLLSSDEEDRAA